MSEKRTVEAGELQQVLAAEKAIGLNVKNVVAYLKDFQQRLEDQKVIIIKLEKTVMQQNQKIDELQQKFYLIQATKADK